MGRIFFVIVAAVLAASCSSGESESASQPEGVDACYREQALLYKEAAEDSFDLFQDEVQKVSQAYVDLADTAGDALKNPYDPGLSSRLDSIGDDFNYNMLQLTVDVREVKKTMKDAERTCK